MENKLIDIIIPCYNAHNTLQKTLSSVAMQIDSDICKVTIVNDCSDKDYKDIVDYFSDKLDIEEIDLDKNLGCGLVRQYGIEHTYCPYIMFIDSDDMLYTPLAVTKLYQQISRNNYNVVYAEFIEYHKSTGFVSVIGARHFVWVFSSIYKRAFIEENGIHFPDNSNGEDLGFTKQIKLFSTFDKCAFLDEPLYLWSDLNKENRINTDEFMELNCKVGFIENILWVYNEIKDKKLPFTKREMSLDYLSNLASMYFQYIKLYLIRPNDVQILIDLASKYYKEYAPIYNKYLSDMDAENILEINNNVFFEKDYYKRLAPITFEEYLGKLSS